MRKETIIKYEKEFLAWCKGESVLLGAPVSMQDRTLIWREVRDFNDWKPLDTVYVLNDSYSIYRKALAEGKTIQLNGTAVNGGYGETWNDCDKENLFIYGINAYRIKPDEPKFKVGDFVRYAHSTPARALEINNINGGRYYFINSKMSCLEHELEPWTPVKGEWCWFYDNPNKDKYCNLSQFGGESNGRCFKTNCGTPWNFCEPFLNSLPSYLKDK